MEIKWNGKTTFTIKGKNTNVLINPEKDMGKFKGEVVLSSLLSNLADVEGAKKVFDWPGEYEVNSVPIIGFQAWDASKTDEDGDNKPSATIIFYFEIDGIKFCHMGELGHKLTKDIIKELGDVDVLMIKAGEKTNLTIKKAQEIIESIDPRALIPMGEETADFLKDLDIEKQESQESLILKTASDLPDNERLLVKLIAQ